MNTQTQEALKMAIEAIEFEGVRDSEEYWLMMDKVRTACKEALEQSAQEPVAWYWDDKNREGMPYAGVLRGNPKLDKVFGTPIPLYTHPHQWQGLTAEEIDAIIKEKDGVFGAVVRAIEQALKEKNHG